MRTKAVKQRIRQSKMKRRMRHKYGPNWRSIRGLSPVIVKPVYAAGPPPTVEEMRLSMRRANPVPVKPTYIEGVSPNAVSH